VIYGGDKRQTRRGIKVKSWKEFLQRDIPV
jgi:hypothetical protein